MIKVIKNPFKFDREVSGRYFCGREKDIKQIVGHIHNNTNIIMFAKRRLGKSSLVKEIFDNQLEEKFLKSHIDIYSVSNTKELYEKIKEGIANSLKGKESSLDKMQSMVEDIQKYFNRSKISLKLSPSPSINIESTSMVYDEAIGDILESYFNYLSNNSLHAVVAIDEFQKIVSLPDNIKIEEVLRTSISKRKNCSFIFTGSRRNWLLSMFSNPERPFYKLGLEHHLSPIDKDIFYQWTLENFKLKDIYIDEDAFSYLYNSANGETRFIQLVSYQIFQTEVSHNIIDESKVREYIDDIIIHGGSTSSYYNTFSIVQQNALKLISKQDGLNIYNKIALDTFNISKPSLQSAVVKLLDIGAIYAVKERYYFENVELGMWLKRI